MLRQPCTHLQVLDVTSQLVLASVDAAELVNLLLVDEADLAQWRQRRP